MSEIQKMLYTDEDGKEYEILIENKSAVNLPDADVDEGRGSRGDRSETIIKMQQAREMIRGYAAYALSAFKDFGVAEIEEITLKFGLKIGGKAGIPFITEGTAESNLEIEVKCKFPKGT